MVLRLESLRSSDGRCGGWDADGPARRAANSDHDGQADIQPPGERENRRKNNPPQQLAEVVARGAQDHVDPIACWTGQVVAIQAVATFQVADCGLDGRAAFYHAAKRPCRASWNRADHMHACRADITVPAIALVYHHVSRCVARQSLHLLDRTTEGVSIVRIAMQGVGADDPIVLARGGHTRLAAELVMLVRFAFGNTFHF